VFFARVGATVLRDVMGGDERHLPILEEYGRDHPAGLAFSSNDLLEAWIQRDVVRAGFLREMEHHRVLLCPAASVPAFRHGARAWNIDGRSVRYLDAMSYTVWFNLLGNPVVVVPVGSSAEGLPIGVQAVGRPYEEDTILAVAAAIERECGGYRAPA